jgi:hypothetical protein
MEQRKYKTGLTLRQEKGCEESKKPEGEAPAVIVDIPLTHKVL